MRLAMRRRALDLLVCPRDHHALELAAPAEPGAEIMEGTLRCVGCEARYPITGGVPRLLPDPERIPDPARATVERFGAQWDRFDALGEHYEAQLLGWIRPNRPEDFAGRVVLEGGCGKGRHSALVARWGAKDVIAVDLGDAVDVAFRNTQGLDNVHVVQADLFHLPLRPASVDVAFSIGVLHHTPDPEGCFRELRATVRPGGKVIAWVYGRENNGWIVHGIDPLRTRLTSRLPSDAVYQLSKLPAALLVALGRGIYAPLGQGRLKALGDRLFYADYIRQLSSFPFSEVHTIVHDHLTPTIAHYIPGPEFRAWFERVGLEDVVVEWHNQNSWRGTGTVPEPTP
mgnify:CR=1 FL=1